MREFYVLKMIRFNDKTSKIELWKNHSYPPLQWLFISFDWSIFAIFSEVSNLMTFVTLQIIFFVATVRAIPGKMSRFVAVVAFFFGLLSSTVSGNMSDFLTIVTSWGISVISVTVLIIISSFFSSFKFSFTFLFWWGCWSVFCHRQNWEDLPQNWDDLP